MVRSVKSALKIPVAVKISPFYTSLAHFAAHLEAAGVDGLVLFNRFYEADIDIEELELRSRLHLSTSDELLLRLRWLAILSGTLKGGHAGGGGRCAHRRGRHQGHHVRRFGHPDGVGAA